MKSAKLLLLTLCLTTAACFSAADSDDISWKPQVGQIAKYEVRDVVTTPFGTKVTFRYNMTTTVASVGDRKVVLEATSTESEVNADGPTGCPIQISGPNGKLLFTPRGHYIPTEEDRDSFAIRIGNLNSMDFPGRPVRVGETWSHEIASDPETGAKAAKAVYKLLGTETIGKWNCYRIGVEYTETEGDEWEVLSSSGTRWLAVADGTPVLERLTIEVPYGVQRLSIEAETKRVK